jgi:hypothetical protein
MMTGGADPQPPPIHCNDQEGSIHTSGPRQKMESSVELVLNWASPYLLPSYPPGPSPSGDCWPPQPLLLFSFYPLLIQADPQGSRGMNFHQSPLQFLCPFSCRVMWPD